MPPRKKAAQAGTVIGYVRVSTAEQKVSGLGLDAQRAKIAEECERRGWGLVRIYADEGISGKAIANRPQLAEAFQAIDRGDASVLMVAKLDRLSRSIADASAMMERSKRASWSIVSCDLAIDDTTPAGEAAAAMMIVFSQLERRLIGQRTSEALQVKKAQGVQLGNPRRHGIDVVERVVDLRAAGHSLRSIAATMMRDEVPTSQGGARWYPSTVAAVLARPEADGIRILREGDLPDPLDAILGPITGDAR